MLSACQTAEPADASFVVADLFATPGKALATLDISPTPVPTDSLPNVPSPTPAPTLPLPTVSILQQPTLPIGTFGPPPTPENGISVVAGPEVPAAAAVSCPQPPAMPFTPVWQNIAQVQALMRCPIGGPSQVSGVWQNYEHGEMFWRESDKSIFVISELGIRQGQPTDTWWRVSDTWVDSEAESDPGLQAPEGLRQPVRGFGKVWRSNGFIREAVGWAVGDERQASILWQEFDGGWMITGPDGSPIWVMAPNDAPPYSSGVHLGPLP